MFQGQYSVKVGSFYRLAFPSPYRERLGGRFIITYGFDNSLIATSEQYWDELFKKEIEGKSFLSPQVRDMRRFFLGGISTIEFDSQGRFIIPEYLREYAQVQMQEEVIYVWQKEYIEIWNKKNWVDRQREVLKNITAIAEKLSGNEFGNE
jgi:MraZ protein